VILRERLTVVELSLSELRVAVKEASRSASPSCRETLEVNVRAGWAGSTVAGAGTDATSFIRNGDRFLVRIGSIIILSRWFTGSGPVVPRCGRRWLANKVSEMAFSLRSHSAATSETPCEDVKQNANHHQSLLLLNRPIHCMSLSAFIFHVSQSATDCHLSNRGQSSGTTHLSSCYKHPLIPRRDRMLQVVFQREQRVFFTTVYPDQKGHPVGSESRSARPVRPTAIARDLRSPRR
jgi:hypothetical protein